MTTTQMTADADLIEDVRTMILNDPYIHSLAIEAARKSVKDNDAAVADLPEDYRKSWESGDYGWDNFTTCAGLAVRDMVLAQVDSRSEGFARTLLHQRLDVNNQYAWAVIGSQFMPSPDTL